MIRIEGLSHYYAVRAGHAATQADGHEGKVERALRDINLEVNKGERLVLLGSSGSGKSTLLRCTNLSIRPTEGRVYIGGREITSLPPVEVKQIRRQVGVISQNFNLLEGASVLKNVILGRLGYVATLSSLLGRFSEEDVAIATEALKRVGLESYIQKRVSDLSGGQKQRVAIARAIAQRSTILLADEPVSSLDPKLMKEIMDLITEICTESNITLVASLHFLELAKSYATRMVGLREGQIVVENTPDELTDKDIIDIYGETEDWVLYGKRGF
ncbi:MAG: phosphonate ABC transporter ATP-binding protein [Dehalococcoidales bacterium]|nr:phosphonate ABC transporter ATP-binding protein [Dehalococcoidales bacterium]